MERRNFVKRLSVFTTGTIALSGSNLYANETENITQSENTSINLSPLLATETILLHGNFIDSITLQPIKNVKMNAQIKRNRFFSLNENIVSNDGKYQILSGFTKNKNQINEKVNIEIKAEGYKTYNSNVYLSPTGCNIHSNEWIYNPNFKVEHCPKNIKTNTKAISSFNFYLVRE